jgi:hypothetical protein
VNAHRAALLLAESLDEATMLGYTVEFAADVAPKTWALRSSPEPVGQSARRSYIVVNGALRAAARADALLEALAAVRRSPA